MRLALLLIPVAAAACTGGGLFGEQADSAVFVGVLTGTVYAEDGTRADAASVFLTDQDGNGAPNEFGASVANGQGHFQIEAIEGSYTLVAHQPGYAAYRAVTIVGGRTEDIGDVYLEQCGQQVPCPEAPTATPTPPPAFVIQNFVPDYTEVTRSYYPSSSYDEVYVRSENFTQGIELTFSFVSPEQYSPGTWSLSTAGIMGWLTYVPATDPYANGYAAVTGSVIIESWNLTDGGLVGIRVSDAQFHWYDQYQGTLDGDYSATIVGSQPMQGQVVLYSR